jgi:hypothetical protein
MSTEKITICDSCGNKTNNWENFHKRVITGQQDRLVAEQTHTELETTKDIDICSECAVEILEKILETKANTGDNPEMYNFLKEYI